MAAVRTLNSLLSPESVSATSLDEANASLERVRRRFLATHVVIASARLQGSVPASEIALRAWATTLGSLPSIIAFGLRYSSPGDGAATTPTDGAGVRTSR